MQIEKIRQQILSQANIWLAETNERLAVLYERYDNLRATRLDFTPEELTTLTREIDLLEQQGLSLQTVITEIEG